MSRLVALISAGNMYPTNGLIARLSPRSRYITLSSTQHQRVTSAINDPKATATLTNNYEEDNDVCVMPDGRAGLFSHRDELPGWLWNTGSQFDAIWNWSGSFEIRRFIRLADMSADNWLLDCGTTANSADLLIATDGSVTFTVYNNIGTQAYTLSTAAGEVTAHTDTTLRVAFDHTTSTCYIDVNGSVTSSVVSPSGTEGSQASYVNFDRRATTANGLTGWTGENWVFGRLLNDQERAAIDAMQPSQLYYTQSDLLNYGPDRFGLWGLWTPNGMSGSGGSLAWVDELTARALTLNGTGLAIGSDATLGVNAISNWGSGNFFQLAAWYQLLNAAGASSMPGHGVDAVFSSATAAVNRFILSASGGDAQSSMLLSNTDAVQARIYDDDGASHFATQAASAGRYAAGINVAPYTVGGATHRTRSILDTGAATVDTTPNLGAYTEATDCRVGVNGGGTEPLNGGLAKLGLYQAARNWGTQLMCLRAIGAGTGGGY